MTNETYGRAVHRSVRLRIAGLVSAIAVIGGTLVVGATPAFANSVPLPLYVGSSLAVGSSSDFSYTSMGFPMARNIEVQAAWFAPNTTVNFVWRDVTASSSWYTGPSATAVPTPLQTYYALADASITAIPSSSCGHTLQIIATGETGTYNGVDESTANFSSLSAGYASTTIVDDCGPKVWQTSNGSSDGIAGDGFTPGGQVEIIVSGPGGSGILSVLSAQAVTATPRLEIHYCLLPVGIGQCVSRVLSAGGTVSVTDSATNAVACGDTLIGYDVSSNLADVEGPIICVY